MLDAVAATGRRVYQLVAWKAIQFGDLSGLQFLHQRGDLDDILNSLCRLAAGGGQLEILKWLRANDFPWGKQTCERAASGGHIEVLQWAHANGCPWNENICACAAYGGHLGVLQWMCTKRLPVGQVDVRERGVGRTPRDAAVGARERRTVGRVDV
jgi:hypothetical protein